MSRRRQRAKSQARRAYRDRRRAFWAVLNVVSGAVLDALCWPYKRPEGFSDERFRRMFIAGYDIDVAPVQSGEAPVMTLLYFDVNAVSAEMIAAAESVPTRYVTCVTDAAADAR